MTTLAMRSTSTREYFQMSEAKSFSSTLLPKEAPPQFSLASTKSTAAILADEPLRTLRSRRDSEGRRQGRSFAYASRDWAQLEETGFGCDLADASSYTGSSLVFLYGMVALPLGFGGFLAGRGGGGGGGLAIPRRQRRRLARCPPELCLRRHRLWVRREHLCYNLQRSSISELKSTAEHSLTAWRTLGERLFDDFGPYPIAGKTRIVLFVI